MRKNTIDRLLMSKHPTLYRDSTAHPSPHTGRGPAGRPLLSLSFRVATPDFVALSYKTMNELRYADRLEEA